MDPSRFLFHPVIVGTPRGACFFFLAAAFGTGTDLLVESPPPRPNKEIVLLGLA
jgi:hypothetical protein